MLTLFQPSPILQVWRRFGRLLENGRRPHLRPSSRPTPPRSTPITTTAGLGFRAVLEPGGGTQVSMVA